MGKAPWWRLQCDFPGQQNPGHGQARAGSPECQRMEGEGSCSTGSAVWSTLSKAEMEERACAWGQTGGPSWTQCQGWVLFTGKPVQDLFLFILFKWNISNIFLYYLFICLHQVLVAARGMFVVGAWA